MSDQTDHFIESARREPWNWAHEAGEHRQYLGVEDDDALSIAEQVEF